MEMADKIKNIRIDNNLSQEKFAELIGISRQSVIAYEKGKTIPQTDVLISICKAFNLDLSYFVNEDVINHNKDDVVINNNENNKKDIILKKLHFDDKTYALEMKNANKELKIIPFNIWQVIIWSVFLIILILNIFIDYIWLIDIPLIFIGIKVNKSSKIDYHIDRYLKKKKQIIDKEGISLSPQYPIYLNIKDDGIYIDYKKEIVFYCPLEMYDHHVMIINNKYQAPLLNVNPSGEEMIYSLAIYLKGNGNPYIISFPLFFKNKKEDDALKFLNRSEYTNCLNNCSMSLKEIKKNLVD